MTPASGGVLESFGLQGIVFDCLVEFICFALQRTCKIHAIQSHIVDKPVIGPWLDTRNFARF
jgi:hypothetical protein